MKNQWLLLMVSLPIMAIASPKETILIGSDLLKAAKIEALYTDKSQNISIAEVSDVDRERIHKLSHDFKRCGGYELLASSQIMSANTIFDNLRELNEKNNSYIQLLNSVFMPLNYNPSIAEAVGRVQTANITNHIEWLSSYKTRHHASETRNVHVMDMKKMLEQMISQSRLSARVDFVEHSRTQQNSLRVRIEGSERPSEIVVLGGHFDSISGWFSKNPAPGADDNASGSSSLIEALRVLLENGVQPQRTVEFFWYAAEEVGLVGSNEIATSYRQSGQDVIAVLQLDMTLFPGSGEFVMGSMTDYTSSWLRQILVDLNNQYIHGRIIESQCGYGCSDHASWYRQGYPTLMPFEATMEDMNRQIHTINDVPSSRTSYEHAAMFSKIAVAFAMELANSNARQPY